MSSKIIKKCIIIIVLLVLSISAFKIWLNNFQNSNLRTVDEWVYYHLALQLKEDITNYTTIPYAFELTAEGRPLPKYFFQPLFKHPPLFSVLLSYSLRIISDRSLSIVFVSLIFGVMLIPLVYFFGKEVFDKRVGILAALFVWFDPVVIISSQKVWMDTMLSFLICLSVFVFLIGLKKDNPNYFILSGILSGLAAVTKYPGILASGIVIIYTLCYRPALFRNQKFLLGLFMPVVVLFPWLLWNFSVYGNDFLFIQSGIHLARLRSLPIFSPFNLIIISLGLILCLIILLNRKKLVQLSKGNQYVYQKWKITGEMITKIILLIMSLVFAISMHKQLAHSLMIDFKPVTTWYAGTFANEPKTFYFGKLLEFSFIYAFAFTVYFIYRRKQEDAGALVRLAAFVILIFFVFWGNYQSRYILPAIPFLLVLAASVVVRIFDKIHSSSSLFFRIFGKFGIILLGVLYLAKALYINLMVSYPNDMCYF